MNDIAAALGIVQLEKLPEMNSRRKILMERYINGLNNINDTVIIPKQKN